MIIAIFFMFVVVLILPIAWLVSEIKNAKKSVRCTLGILAILSCFGVAFISAQIVRLNYNIWYSSATVKLLDSTIAKLEQGQADVVIKNLKTLREQIPVTYERRGNYDELVRDLTKTK